MLTYSADRFRPQFCGRGGRHTLRLEIAVTAVRTM